jgi:hypothetical protein
MGFLKKLFGGDQSGSAGDADPDGFFLYVRCDNCGKGVRLRVDRKHDLNLADGGYVWHKTVVDSKCFRPIPTVVHFDGNYNVTHSDIEGGQYISKEEYESLEVSQTTEDNRIDR